MIRGNGLSGTGVLRDRKSYGVEDAGAVDVVLPDILTHKGPGPARSPLLEGKGVRDGKGADKADGQGFGFGSERPHHGRDGRGAGPLSMGRGGHHGSKGIFQDTDKNGG